jgi:hypothetical protein
LSNRPQLKIKNHTGTSFFNDRTMKRFENCLSGLIKKQAYRHACIRVFKLNKHENRHEKKCMGVFLVKKFGIERVIKRKCISVRDPTN